MLAVATDVYLAFDGCGLAGAETGVEHPSVPAAARLGHPVKDDLSPGHSRDHSTMLLARGAVLIAAPSESDLS